MQRMPVLVTSHCLRTLFANITSYIYFEAAVVQKCIVYNYGTHTIIPAKIDGNACLGPLLLRRAMGGLDSVRND